MEATIFHNLCSEVSYHHLHFILSVTQTNPNAVWEGATGGCEYQEARLTGAISEADDHTQHCPVCPEQYNILFHSHAFFKHELPL